MINWKIHPRAVAANVTYLNDEDKTVAFDRVDRPTQTKTVADAVEQDGEEWTHTTSLGKCRILIDKPDEHGYVVIESEFGGYSLIPPRSLKPIKPTLSKSEAWDLCQDYDGHKNMKAYMYDLHEEYDII